MNKEPYTIEQLRAVRNIVARRYRWDEAAIIDDKLHEEIIMDTLNDAIDQLKAKSRKKRKKNRNKTHNKK